MITSLLGFLTWNRIKTGLIIFAALAVVWLYKSWEYRGEEMRRQQENVSQLRKLDSFQYASQTYTQDEIVEYLEYQRQDLNQFLEDNRVESRRIERIVTQKLKYLDTLSRKQDLSPILKAIRANKSTKVAVKDSTECLIVKGWVVFENDSLTLDITDRKFLNITDVVSYWERRKWSFLGIKTRLFGKKQATVIVKDKCGVSKTIVIDKK